MFFLQALLAASKTNVSLRKQVKTNLALVSHWNCSSNQQQLQCHTISKLVVVYSHHQQTKVLAARRAPSGKAAIAITATPPPPRSIQFTIHIQAWFLASVLSSSCLYLYLSFLIHSYFLPPLILITTGESCRCYNASTNSFNLAA